MELKSRKDTEGTEEMYLAATASNENTERKIEKLRIKIEKTTFYFLPPCTPCPSNLEFLLGAG
jgi:hypothetical protein